jgi:hypothetical protein
MKIFWSWQSDTPGKIGRHFVRDALLLAIDALKQAPDVEEPTAAATREGLHLDHDRQGVSGSPDLAHTIFEKIDRSTVFVADVTLVGTSDEGSKRLINSNVGIEYGHAHRGLGDEAILMVQNTHYGPRDALPFDLKHKAGPIQFNLAPGAKKPEIEAEQKKLVAQFVTALRPYLERGGSPAAAPFQEAASTSSPAIFFQPGELLGRLGIGTEDEIEYRFGEPRVFYLRVMPGTAQSPIKQTQLLAIASQNRPDVLSPYRFSGYLDRNRFGGVAIEASGTSTTPRSLTQLFVSGEIWGISTHFFRTYHDHLAIPITALENIYWRVLSNYCDLLTVGMGIALPFTVVLGAVGLNDVHVGIDNTTVAGPIYTDHIEIRRVLHDLSKPAQEAIVREFVDAILDLAGVSRS